MLDSQNFMINPHDFSIKTLMTQIFNKFQLTKSDMLVDSTIFLIFLVREIFLLHLLKLTIV